MTSSSTTGNEIIDNKISSILSGTTYFILGLLIGIVVFFLFILVIYLIIRNSKKTKAECKVQEVDQLSLDFILDNAKKEYREHCQHEKDLKKKMSEYGIIVMNMVNDTAKLYYPESDMPIFEQSPERFVELLDYLKLRIEDFFVYLVSDKYGFIFQLFKVDPTKMKIAQILDIIEKSKEKKEQEIQKAEKEKEEMENAGFFRKVGNFFKNIPHKIISTVKKGAADVGMKVLTSKINDEFLPLLDVLEHDITLFYSGAKMKFDLALCKQANEVLEKEENHDDNLVLVD